MGISGLNQDLRDKEDFQDYTINQDACIRASAREGCKSKGMGIKKENLRGKTGVVPKQAIKTGYPAAGQKVNQRLSSSRGRNNMTRYNAAQ